MVQEQYCAMGFEKYAQWRAHIETNVIENYNQIRWFY